MLDCACLAGIIALRHFRRPEVEVIGDEVIVVRHSSRGSLDI
jgi:exosome complex component RRP45